MAQFSKLDFILKSCICCMTLRGCKDALRDYMKLSLYNHPITTCCLVTLIQHILCKGGGSHWLLIILLKQLRVLFPILNRICGTTRFSWIFLYCFITWNSFQPLDKNWNHPGFSKLTGWFNTMKKKGMPPVNEYNQSSANDLIPCNLMCEPDIYHPQQTCVIHTMNTLKTNFIACLNFYPKAYLVTEFLRSRQKIYQHPLEWLLHVFRLCLHSTGYAVIMAQGNRLFPCFLKWINEHTQSIFQTPIMQLSLFFPFTIVFILGMFAAEHPNSRIGIWDYTFAYTALGLFIKTPILNKLDDRSWTSVLSGLVFFMLHHQWNNTIAKTIQTSDCTHLKPSSPFEKLAKFLFV